jgi:hypothetical protein
MLPLSPYEQKVNLESSKATYNAVAADYTPYANATDMVVLRNPDTSTKIIKLARVIINGNVTTTAGYQDIYGVIQDILNTGGTIAGTPTIRKYDAADATASGVVIYYSTAPTVGSGAQRSVIRAGHYAFPATVPAFPSPEIIWEFGDHAAKSLTLYPGQQFSVSCDSQAITTGLNIYVTFEWTEE